MTNSFRAYWVIYITTFIMLMLSFFPLPNWAEPYRPEWVALTIVYWCMHAPVMIGLGAVFVFGVILDIAMGTLLGQHALGLAIIAFIVLKNHQRLRLFPVLQQALVVLILLVIKQLLFLWVYGITERAPENLLLYFMPSIISMFLWPWFSIIMQDIQRRFFSKLSHKL